MDYNSHPETVAEAVDVLLDLLTDEDRKKIAEMEKDELFNLHFGMGTWIRNNFGLWGPESPLMKDTGVEHPDDASGVVIDALWTRLSEGRNDRSLQESRDTNEKSQKIRRLHLIENKNLWKSWTPGEDTYIGTGYWSFTPEDARSFVGCWLFLHRHQTDPSHMAGKIVDFRIQDTGRYEGRIVFKVERDSGLEGLVTTDGGWERWWKID